jgi:uncharacterized protein (UPF0548 family)
MRPVLAWRLRGASVDCQRWRAAPVTDLGPIETGRGQRHHAELRFRGDEARFERALGLVMRYAMFPPSLLVPTVCSDGARLAPGMTVVQRIFMGPLGVESGIRVTSVFDERSPEARRAGFECATLDGHPERGVERFALTLAGDEIRFEIDARSELAALYARLGPPFARFFQHRAVRAALRHVSESTA